MGNGGQLRVPKCLVPLIEKCNFEYKNKKLTNCCSNENLVLGSRLVLVLLFIIIGRSLSTVGRHIPYSAPLDENINIFNG